MTPLDLLDRLRDPSDAGPPARLASLLVDEALARPLADVVDGALVVSAARELLAAFAGSDLAEARVTEALEGARATVRGVSGPVGAALPPAARDALGKLAALPIVVRRDAVLRLLDRPATRQVLRAQIVRTLSDFGRKAASPVADSSLARGLGGLGKLAGQIARPGPLGALANAVSGEVERQVEKRAADFADTAVAGVLAGIAEHMSDPARAAEQAALREDLVAGLLALEGSDVAGLAGDGLAKPVAIARAAAAELAKDGALAAQLEALLAALVARDAARPLGDVLVDLGLRDVVRRHALEAARRGLARLVESLAFAAWISDLLA